MNDCLFHATREHAACLGVELDGRDFAFYRALNGFYMRDSNAPVWGGVAPAVVSALAETYGMGRRLEYNVWTPAHYAASAETEVLRRISGLCWFGATEGITLAPAIYLVLDSRHAVFAEQKPPGLVVAAIQLIKRKDFEK